MTGKGVTVAEIVDFLKGALQADDGDAETIRDFIARLSDDQIRCLVGPSLTRGGIVYAENLLGICRGEREPITPLQFPPLSIEPGGPRPEC